MMKILVVSLLLVLAIAQHVIKDKEIRKFSFDHENGRNPLIFHSYGSAVNMKNKIKLIPPIADRYGAVFANQLYRSFSFDMDLVFRINSNFQTSDGFVFWYSPRIPKFNKAEGRIHGVGKDTRGLSIWLHKNEKNKWRLFAYYDNGKVENLESARILPDNSCTLLLDPTREDIKLRIHKDNNKFELYVTDDNAQSDNWRKWVAFHNSGLKYKGYFGFTSGNSQYIQNDIDLKSMVVADLDPKSIYNKKDYNDEVKYVDFREEKEADIAGENPKETEDIFHFKRKANEYSEAGRAIKVDPKASQEEMLFKIWETVRAYNM